MKVFFTLIFFAFILAKCQGECIGSLFLPELKDGIKVWPSTCVDDYDGKKHLIGSTWDTARCFRCVCHSDGMHCCKRHVRVSNRQGCIIVVNPEICEYEFYRAEAPTWRC